MRVCTDYALCLHSKERVPYHIIIEVAYEEDERQHIDDLNSSINNDAEDSAYSANDFLDRKKLKKKIFKNSGGKTEGAE